MKCSCCGGERAVSIEPTWLPSMRRRGFIPTPITTLICVDCDRVGAWPRIKHGRTRKPRRSSEAET